MPRAKTGCDHVLYTVVSKDAIKQLQQMVAKSDCKSRPLLVDAIIKRAAKLPLPRVKLPDYKPHKRTQRKSLNATA